MASAAYPLRFGIQIPQQHTTWPEILSLAQEVDDLGYDTLWLFDHFLPISSDPTGPCLEGWTALTALAMATKRARLGLMVTGNTYRHPAVFAKMATTLDIISGGRLILGIGAGWFELEHQQYGIPFHTVRGRLRRLDEALNVIKLLWTEERANFNGEHYQLRDASLNPKPIQRPHPPILVGASGEKSALRIVAKHADMWNSFGGPEEFRRKIGRLEEHCTAIGRDPATIEKSVLGDAIPIGDARRQVEGYFAAGVSHIIYSVPTRNRDWVGRFAQEIIPAVRER
jgi:F420-dependent oxidoreductase-like protein